MRTSARVAWLIVLPPEHHLGARWSALTKGDARRPKRTQSRAALRSGFSGPSARAHDPPHVLLQAAEVLQLPAAPELNSTSAGSNPAGGRCLLSRGALARSAPSGCGPKCG